MFPTTIASLIDTVNKPLTPVHCPGCTKGQEYCEHKPGWFAPSEAEAAIKDGFGRRLMLDYWDADGQLPYTEVVSAPIIGYEGNVAPHDPLGICAFLTENKQCELHGKFKPLECGVACCKVKYDDSNVHFRMAQMWDSDEGRRVVALWKKANSMKGNSDD